MSKMELKNSDILNVYDRFGIVFASIVFIALPLFVIGWLIGLFFNNGILPALIISLIITFWTLMGMLFVKTRGQLRTVGAGVGAMSPIYWVIQAIIQVIYGLIFSFLFLNSLLSFSSLLSSPKVGLIFLFSFLNLSL